MVVSPRYLFIEDAATYLGTSEKALRRRVERRTIPFIKDGRRLKFDTHVLDTYMAARLIDAKPFSPLKREVSAECLN